MNASVLKVKRLVALVSVSLVVSACSTMEGYREKYPEPDDRLDHILALYESQREQGKQCHEIWYPGTETTDCGRLLAELDRLLVEFPNHGRIMMANAVYGYNANRLDRAAQVLDQLLSRPGVHPEAAVLRARIALEEGNDTLAEQVLRRQIMLSPGDPNLQSALASVHYLRGEYSTARNILNLQRQRSDRPWELNYHLGLLAEGEGNWAAACKFYQQAVIQNQDFAPAAARIVGLAAHIPCSDSASGSEGQSSAVTYPVDTGTASISDATAFILNDIQVSEVAGNRVTVSFATQGYNPNVRALQVAKLGQVIVDLPGATSNVAWQSNDFQNDFVKSVSIEGAGDRVRARVALKAKVDAQLVNDSSGLRLVLVGGR